ncbi:ABC transporter permease [Geminicoccaceae bacterium 1502E]|nr:ABC transporter permease [Geminicoccaceae bacterium 1502E]
MVAGRALEEAAGQRQAVPGRRGLRLRLWAPVASLLALFVLWQLVAVIAADPRLMPPPGAVLARLAEEAASGELAHHLAATLARVAASFVIAMAIGTGLGVLMGRSLLADLLGQPWLVFFLNLPALVTIVLAYIWIGLVESAAVLAVAMNKIPNVMVTVREGARAIDRSLIEMAEVFAVPRGRVLRHVVLPQLYPYLAAAARSGLALIWKIVLVVELLGRSEGVGFQISIFFQLFDVTGILAYALAFIAIVQLIEWGVLQPIERRLGQWRR